MSVMILGFAACAATLVQDAVRLTAIADGRATLALAADVVWLAVACAYFGMSLTRDTGTAEGALVAWAVGAGVSALVGLWLLGSRPRFRDGLRWVRDTTSLGRALATDAVIGVGASACSLLLVGVVAGREPLAGLRGAFLLLGPMNALTEGVYLAVVPGLATVTASGRSVLRSTLRMAALLAFLWSSFALVMIAIPDMVFVAALGDTWTVAEPVLPFLLASSVVGAVAIAGLYGIRAWRGGPQLVRTRVAQLPFYLVALPFFAWLGGATAYAAALVGVAGLQVLLYWVTFHRLDSTATA
jgi:O-antigen/teichoic acid export membrane protein